MSLASRVAFYFYVLSFSIFKFSFYSLFCVDSCIFIRHYSFIPNIEAPKEIHVPQGYLLHAGGFWSLCLSQEHTFSFIEGEKFLSILPKTQSFGTGVGDGYDLIQLQNCHTREKKRLEQV